MSHTKSEEELLKDEPSSRFQTSQIPANEESTTSPTTARPAHPYENASLFSKLFFLWPLPLLKLGLERPLTDHDLADVAPIDSSRYNLEFLKDLWETHNTNSHGSNNKGKHDNQSLARILFWDLIKTTWFVQPMFAAAMVAKVAQAVCLGFLIESFEEYNADHNNNNNNNNKEGHDTSDADRSKGYLWATAVVLCGVVTLFEHHHVFFILWRKGMQFRIACVAAIYDKALRLSSTHPETLASNGRIMNLASNDVERFLYTCLFISFFWWAPLQAVGILGVGIWLMGPAFCAGILLLACVFTPLQMYLSRQFAHYRSTIAALTDERVTFVSQAVRGARVMKMSGYEDQFLQRIQTLRETEVTHLRSAIRLKAANEAIFFVTNIVVSLTIFLVHVYTGGVLKPGDVFTVFTLVNVMQLELVKHVQIAIMTTSECQVSLRRIQQFLEFPEIHPLQPPTPMTSGTDGEDKTGTSLPAAISMTNVSCKWDQVMDIRQSSSSSSASSVTSQQNQDGGSGSSSSTSSSNVDELALTESSSSSSTLLALQNVSATFHHGTLTAVIGPVGSGKSALVQALVQELSVFSGSITRNYNTLAYAAQDPWIMDGTIQENIVMGFDMDRNWYQQVVQACSLLVDFSQLRDGDQTIVGDRGVQLSGGQRARIGLARALYKNANVLVLDDPLSAVDARVGRHLFQQAIMDLSVRQGKCVVLATHQHQYIGDARCLLILGGQVMCTGSYQECVAASQGKLTAHAADTAPTTSSSGNSCLPNAENNKSSGDDGEAEVASEKGEGEDAEQEESPNDAIAETADGTSNPEEQAEQKRQGVVHRDTFVNYLKAMGGIGIGVFLFALFTCTQGSVLVTVASMGRWAERDPSQQKDADIVSTVVSMSALVVILAVFRAYLSLELTIKASQTLHDRMTAAVLRAKIEFFDTNPLGRILNRFSADIGIADDQLPQTLFDVFVIGFIVLGAVITALTTLPFALAVVPFLVWYFVRVRRIFVTSTRELKRLEGLARSPIFAMLSEALGGIATIRANDYMRYFQQKFQVAHDAHTRIFFGFISASRWVGFRMDSIVFLFLAVVNFLAVLVQTQGWFDVDPAILGLSISMLIYLSGVFQWCIRQSAEVVNQMVSVERVLEFGKLEPEASLNCKVDDKLTSWPTAGEIEYDKVSVRYRAALPLALQRISFRIPAGARVGVVGRTGSGKSTVVQSLFRLLEPEEGRILIDGQDVSELGLHKLRTNISVIPQVPTLFSGCTVRENLDLFQLHSDDEIRQVLAACHLEVVVGDMPEGWNSVVSEGGSNFSVGQRQLLCLARALLSRNKILVLDEATASVDRRTDQLLQEALQHSYRDGTILAVAHRLDTVIDYDFILVLGHGEVVEFGSPADLLSDDNGVFARMVQDTGVAMSQSLREKANLSAMQKKDI